LSFRLQDKQLQIKHNRLKLIITFIERLVKDYRIAKNSIKVFSQGDCVKRTDLDRLKKKVPPTSSQDLL